MICPVVLAPLPCTAIAITFAPPTPPEDSRPEKDAESPAGTAAATVTASAPLTRSRT